jgi:protease-4
MKRFFFSLIILSLLIFIGLVIWLLTPESQWFAGPNQIGVIELRGLIDSVQDPLKAFREFRKNTNVKCVLLRIESPGGGIGASQELYREVKRTIEVKPVVASLGGIAASGGYYIASAANRIVANPGTITGSIGVISYFPNLQELFKKIGFSANIIKSGRFKDIGNPDREMTHEERELLQSTMDEAHRQFIRDVARGRNLPEEKVREVADGRILMGEKAQQLGLVDELGNFEDAIKISALLGKIEEEPDLLYARKKKHSLLDFLIGSEISEQLDGYINGSLSFLRYQVPSM